MNSSRVPALRPSVEVVESSGEGRVAARLKDAELGQSIRIDALTLAVVRGLGAPRTVGELSEMVGGEEAAVQRIVATLERLQVLQTPKSEGFIASQAAARAMAEADPATVPLLIRDDARFTCSMCGSCCGGQNVGPVAPTKIEALRPHFPQLRALTGVTKPLFMTVPVTVDGAKVDRTICQSSGGVCVFLGDDKLCTIHGTLGAAAKPDVCQIFPYQFKATPEGISVSLGMECRGFVQARQGAKLQDQEAAIRQMLTLVPVSTLRSVIPLDDALTVDYTTLCTLEASMHQAVEGHPNDAGAALLAMKRELDGLRDRERGFPLAAAPSDDLEQWVRDLQCLQEEMLHSLGELHEAYDQGNERVQVHTGSLDLLARAVAGLLPDLRRVVQPMKRRAGRELFGEYAHHALAGKEMLRARHLVLGQARFAFSWFLAKAMAIDRIHQVKRRHLLPQDIQDALVVVHFLFRGQDALEGLRRHDSQVISIFHDRLPLLLKVASSYALADESPILYKF